MGVSMTPVREALDLLVAKGIAERVPYRGVRVREMSTKDIVEAYSLRLTLEALIAREAAVRTTLARLAVSHPWSPAAQAWLDTRGKVPVATAAADLSGAIGIPEPAAEDLLDVLVAAGAALRVR